ncbi:MAG: alkaline phosphatase D family protein [Rhodoferax sp.]|nr:alkaline phosphatase D family protein [Rhodoferax sp.]MDP3652823.1 alkaline phosphatase D family protein [Rhodoferax sp.]
MQLDRRQLLQLAVAGASVQWLARTAHSQSSFSQDPFAFGVASGSPTHDSVVLWTRLAPGALVHERNAPLTVRWELAHDPQFKRLVSQGQSAASPELGYSVHVEVPGLKADRWYHYRFMVGDAVSPTGRTRTFPLPDAPVHRLRLGYASCQKWEDGHFSAWRHMRAENLDAVLFMGDYIYEYPGVSSKLRTPGGGWVLTLDDYRARYALYKTDADLQAMHATCPWLMTWDDHEVQNDYAGDQGGDSGPPGGLGTMNFPARRAAAYQAYYENMPLRASALTQALGGLARGAEMRIHTHLQFGRLASLYLLDGRQYKDPQVCSKAGKRGSSVVDPAQCALWNDPQRSYLGMAQERWLQGELESAASRQALWNVLGQQTLFGERNFARGAAKKLWNDGWDGYSAARTRLTDSFQKHAVANPVLLGGDVHENWVGHVKADYANPASANVGVEFCGTSITSHSGKTDATARLLAENPHFLFADSQSRGYGVAEFSARQLEVRLRVLDDVTRPDSSIETLARFAVQAGRSVVERA